MINQESGEAMHVHQEYGVPEDPSRLHVFDAPNVSEAPEIAQHLRADDVILARGLTPEHADAFAMAIARELQLGDQLELQATFASIKGHRERNGESFMTVNLRDDDMFILSHSEGDCRTNIQLSAFYCHDNTTDGGVTIMQNTDPQSTEWSKLREVATKIDLCGKTLSPREVVEARVIHEIHVPRDIISSEDEILAELPPPFPGTKAYTVLAPMKPIRSVILDKTMYAFWDNVSSTDYDSGHEYMRLLQSCGLLRTPQSGRVALSDLDYTYGRKKWRSGLSYERLFKARITRKLAKGELIMQNNLTWTHSASNWTPGSGVRKVVAAFA